MRLAGVEPAEPYIGSEVPWRCRCLTCGREVTPRLGNVRAGHGACAYCAGRAVDPDEAAAVMRAAGLEPAGPYPGAARPWPCRCMVCGRESRPRYATVSKGTGCRYCAVDRAAQALRLDPEAAAGTMRDAGLEPLETYPGAGAPWRCRCTSCGREVTPRYDDVRGGHRGCKWCAWQATAASLRMDHETAAVTMIERDLEPLEPYPGSSRLMAVPLPALRRRSHAPAREHQAGLGRLPGLRPGGVQRPAARPGGCRDQRDAGRRAGTAGALPERDDPLAEPVPEVWQGGIAPAEQH